MSIKRYEANGSSSVFEHTNGSLVDYEDYVALEQKLADLAVQLANAESKCRELAAENAGLNAAFDRPDAWLSWHSIPPTFYEPDRGGEYLQVHEQPGEKNDDGSDSWAVYSKPESETPATDAFLAEVRAQGVEIFGDYLNGLGWDEADIKQVREFAAQLRKGVEI